MYVRVTLQIFRFSWIWYLPPLVANWLRKCGRMVPVHYPLRHKRTKLYLFPLPRRAALPDMCPHNAWAAWSHNSYPPPTYLSCSMVRYFLSSC